MFTPMYSALSPMPILDIKQSSNRSSRVPHNLSISHSNQTESIAFSPQLSALFGGDFHDYQSGNQVRSQSFGHSSFDRPIETPLLTATSNDGRSINPSDDWLDPLALPAPVVSQHDNQSVHQLVQSVAHPNNESMNQSINQSTNQPVDSFSSYSMLEHHGYMIPEFHYQQYQQQSDPVYSQSINQSLNQMVHPLNHQSSHQPINQSINQSVNHQPNYHVMHQQNSQVMHQQHFSNQPIMPSSHPPMNQSGNPSINQSIGCPFFQTPNPIQYQANQQNTVLLNTQMYHNQPISQSVNQSNQYQYSQYEQPMRNQALKQSPDSINRTIDQSFESINIKRKSPDLPDVSSPTTQIKRMKSEGRKKSTQIIDVPSSHSIRPRKKSTVNNQMSDAAVVVPSVVVATVAKKRSLKQTIKQTINGAIDYSINQANKQSSNEPEQSNNPSIKRCPFTGAVSVTSTPAEAKCPFLSFGTPINTPISQPTSSPVSQSASQTTAPVSGSPVSAALAEPIDLLPSDAIARVSSTFVSSLVAESAEKHARLARKAELARVARRGKVDRLTVLQGEYAELEQKLEDLKKKTQSASRPSNQLTMMSAAAGCPFFSQSITPSSSQLGNQWHAQTGNTVVKSEMTDEPVKSSASPSLLPLAHSINASFNNSSTLLSRFLYWFMYQPTRFYTKCALFSTIVDKQLGLSKEQREQFVQLTQTLHQSINQSNNHPTDEPKMSVRELFETIEDMMEGQTNHSPGESTNSKSGNRE